MKEQIKEMAKALMNAINEKQGHTSMRALAEALYNAGYRKQSDVIDEFAKRLKAYPINNLEKMLTIAEIIDEVAMKMKGE